MFNDTSRSFALPRHAEVCCFSPITLLSDKFLITDKKDRFRQGIKDEAVRQSFRKKVVIFLRLVFQVGTATATMARSTVSGPTATGGPLRRTLVPTRGTAT